MNEHLRIFFGKLNFIVVDDVSAMCQITANQLRSLGAIDVQTASNGADALRMMRQRHTDMVLADWNMPVMDGLGLLQAMRNDPMLVQIPMIMVTAEANRERIAQAISSGVSDLLVKPYTTARLVDKISGAFQRSGKGPALPAMPAAPPRTAAPPKPPLPTLLVVDDTPENVRLIADLFENQFRVRVAHNGPKAIAMCTTDNPPDLILLDVMMPEMDGFEVARRLRAHPTSAHIPIIFVTALTDDAARRKGLDLGAVDFVSKPVDPDILQLRVQNFMRYIAVHLQRQSEYDALLDTARLREDVEKMLRHDIRAPLAGVVSLARALAADPAMAPGLALQALMIEQSAQQALATVNLSSDLMTIESGGYKLQPEPFDLGAMLRQVGQSTHAAHSGGSRSLDFDLPVGNLRALGDPDLSQSVFYNLFKNAFEAAPEHSKIIVRVQDGDPLTISIDNAGVVPADMRERFFVRNATSGKTGGSGIGTYSAKRLTEAQRGSIDMQTSDESGRTVVSMRLPKAGT